MSDDNESPGAIAAEVRPLAGHEPFTLAPLIEDILRTRYCVPGSIFLVENLESVPVSKSGRWHAVQLLLGDGELCIQALLSGPLRRFVQTNEVSVGCYVRIEKFDIKTISISNDEGGKRDMVYLEIEDLIAIGWNDAYRTMWVRQTGQDLEELASENDLDLDEMNQEYTEEQVEDAQMGEVTEPAEPDEIEDEHEDEAAFEDAFDAFEAMKFPRKPSRPAVEKSPAASSSSAQPVALPRDWHDRTTPLKLTTLHAIPRLPYPQNWCCNVLAIITSLSPVEPSYLPPYRQRTARIADPSTSKQVHLTVFLDPEKFEPKVGNAVLLVGVKNHRFDGGSLKKYASDAAKTGGAEWWFEDPWDMGWCDVDGIKSWWKEVQKSIA